MLAGFMPESTAHAHRHLSNHSSWQILYTLQEVIISDHTERCRSMYYIKKEINRFPQNSLWTLNGAVDPVYIAAFLHQCLTCCIMVLKCLYGVACIQTLNRPHIQQTYTSSTPSAHFPLEQCSSYCASLH